MRLKMGVISGVEGNQQECLFRRAFLSGDKVIREEQTKSLLVHMV
jgi:hypothetical protein